MKEKEIIINEGKVMQGLFMQHTPFNAAITYPVIVVVVFVVVVVVAVVVVVVVYRIRRHNCTNELES